MKKLFIGCGLALSLVLSSYSLTSSTPAEAETSAIKCHHGQCQATAKSTGNQCKHCVSNEGDLYCWQHD